MRAISALGASLGLAGVAEGIETKEQLARMRQLGLSLGQGFFFAKPVPREQAEDLLARGSLIG